MGEDQQRDEIQTQGDGGERQREIPDHPTAMRGEVASEDAAIGHPPGEKPEYGEQTEVHVGGPAFLRKHGQRKTSGGTKRDRAEINSSEPAMQGRLAEAQPPGELPRSDEQSARAAENVGEQKKIVVAEMAGRAMQKIVRRAEDHGGAKEEAQTPTNQGERARA